MNKEKFIPITIKSDNDGHDFIIPIELSEEFNKLLEDGYEEDNFEKFYQVFGKYQIGGCVSLYQLYISESEMMRLIK